MQNPKIEPESGVETTKEIASQSDSLLKACLMSEEQRAQAEQEGMDEIQNLAARLKDLILSQPPLDLLGYLYSPMLRNSMAISSLDEKPVPGDDSTSLARHQRNEKIGEIQFILEYIHAVFSSFEEGSAKPLDKKVCAEIFEVAEELRLKTLLHCMFTSSGTEDGVFGPKTAEVEFFAKTNWVSIRGNRHQVLEEEFFNFTLETHDTMLRRTYGASSSEIAAGFQNIADSVRTGYMRAANLMFKQQEFAQKIAEERGETLKDVAKEWRAKQPERLVAFLDNFNDIFQGGICNVSKHSSLPALLLEDLSFKRGEETEFFKPGPYCGTPLRTLPARKKPLVQLHGEYFAIDPSFARDSSYRALLWNLLKHNPNYQEEFNIRQKEMSEGAFQRIFSEQLAGLTVDQEVWYKDPDTGQWCENDTLIRLDDVLILVEAKAGAAATIASPELDFYRHVRSVQDLITKAYDQCHRFFRYLSSADAVPIYERKAGRYVEVDCVCLADYRVILPIGLTVESFSPFSAMCKELPAIKPVLGRYPFVSVSIDDLLVINRFLPTAGELAHYFEVRQAVAGIEGSVLYDEMDHLGAYIERNRIDLDLKNRLADGASKVILDGMCEKVNAYFEGEDWLSNPIPTQEFPNELKALLHALNTSRATGWLSCESCIRDFSLGHEGRNKVSNMLQTLRMSLGERDYRYFSVSGSETLIVWLQRIGTEHNADLMLEKVQESAIAANSSKIICVLAWVSPNGNYVSAERIFEDVSLEGDTSTNGI